MVKHHNCLVNIQNNTTSPMTYQLEWYDSGRVADGFSWPSTIAPGEHVEILSYEKDNSAAGCSGYVTYSMEGGSLTIAFSNPEAGHDKLGVGNDGKSVWDHMSNHGYKSFTVTVPLRPKRTLSCLCQCTGGHTNTCSVILTMAYDESDKCTSGLCNLF